jgi:hypothetical protein
LFRANTVLVIGAGASAELGFPLGDGLLKDIAQRIDISYDFGRLGRGDYVVADALRNKLNARQDVTQYNEHLHSAWQIVKSSKQALSIDNVLDALEDPRASLVGKFGIVRSILSAENKSPLSKWLAHFPNDIDISALDGTWLDHLTRLLTEGRRKSAIGDIFENLSIINFNYDRSIEQYLPFSLANYYGLEPAVIREVMPTLSILRPYGKAGSLPWEADGAGVEFGGCDAGAVEKAAEMILTFTEQVKDRALLGAIRRTLESAERIIFLGFGFHRQNLKVLECAGLPHVEILATSFGISKSDSASIQTELENSFELSQHDVLNHDYVRMLPLRCGEFMKEVGRTLTSERAQDPRIEYPELPKIELPAFANLR